MKRTLLIGSFLIFILFRASATTLDSIPVNQKDVESSDAIITSLYDVISGPAGQARNWDRMRTLFLPGARMIAIGRKADGSSIKREMTVEQYILSSGQYLEKDGFFEREISRKKEEYGSIVHVFSTYAYEIKGQDKKPFMRGINSIQLWNDGQRWWIVNILWQGENKDSVIPEKYLE
jgi:hypothetical protein